MQKKVAGFWISVPCDHDVGSCSYSICTNKTADYPELFPNANPPKKCPAIPVAVYSVADLVVDVKKSLPSIAQGDFHITIDFNSDYAGHLACLHLSLSLK